jgi:oxygen-independent coproporphyrinogen-3 oxidase
MPWCVRKCPYCDFNSHAAPPQIPQRAYIDALLQDLECELPEIASRPIVSVFFGGGTPSLFDPERIARFLEGVRALRTLSTHAALGSSIFGYKQNVRRS